jgi:two-component system response regulator PhoP
MSLAAHALPLQILIVEDDADQRRVLRAALEKGGHVVAHEAERGDDPVLGTDPDVDVAIVDLNLPGASGIEVIRTLLTNRPFLPVLVLSASDHQQAITEALFTGALGYIVKGARFQEVLDAVELVARRRPVLSEQARTALAPGGANVDEALARIKRWL